MAYVTTSYGRPIQGVSQQPDRIRLEGQCTLQENFIPDLVKGLTRRPSTYLVNELEQGILSYNAKFHSYDRGGEAYLIILKPNEWAPDVYNLQGVKQRVEGYSSTYLPHGNPYRVMDMKTVGDTTFITNSTIPVRMSSERSPVEVNRGLVYVAYATYGKEYSIIVNGTNVATYTTPDGAEAPQIAAVKTNYVTRRLYLQIVGGTIEAVPGAPAATFVASTWLNASLEKNVITIWMKDGSDFTLETVDSQNGKDLVAVKGSLRSVATLPPNAPEGFIIRITGAGKSEKDDYWLKAVKNTDSDVRWVETVQPNTPISFDATTMPHVLVRESIGSDGIANFSLKVGDWAKREVGGKQSNPLPSFIDEEVPITIQSTGVFQNRLFFLSGEAWIASRSGLFFNFWRETSQTSIDTDPLDAYADTDRVNNLYNYQILNGDLAIFADQAQFIIKGDKPVTKDNITLQQVTAYPTNILVEPQAAGENVFFAYDASGFVGIRELYTDSYSDTKKAFPITDYVSKYLNGSCIQLLASPRFNTLMVRTDFDRSRVYVYDWLWQGEQKVQSAWHTWIMDGSVQYLFYYEDFMYIVYQKEDKLFLDYLYMVNDPMSDELDYSICLDHKRSVNCVYNPDYDNYSFVLPYNRTDAVATISTGGDVYSMGSSFEYRQDGVTCITEDNIADKHDLKVVVGIPYKSNYIPTQPTVKDARDRVIGLSKIVMSNLYVHYEDTGFIRMVVSPRDALSRSYDFYGRWMGSNYNLVGSPILTNGTYRTPIRQRAEDLVVSIQSDSHYPLTIRDLEMDGTFHQRGQRI